jgi:hypothetical protein
MYVDKPLRGRGLMPVRYVLRCPRSGKCRLVRDSILCRYGLGRDTACVFPLSRGTRSKRSGLVTRRIAQTRTLGVAIRTVQSAPELRRRPQRGKQVLDGHAHSVVRVDKACVNDPVSANNEGGGNRQHPIVGTL